MDCTCEPSKGKMDEMKKIYDSSTDLNDFAGLYNEAGLGSTVWIECNAIYFSYPAYCACVNKIDKPIAKVWCYCTLGYAKNMFILICV